MKKQLAFAAVLTVFLAGCASTMEMGKGGSMVTGAAGNSGAQGEAKELTKCAATIATVEVDDPGAAQVEVKAPGGLSYSIVAQQMGLPADPKPLMRLILAQTGCFTVVDRAVALRAAKREHELAEAGLTRKKSSVKKGNVVEAQYTLVPQIVFSQKQASGSSIGSLVGFLPIPGASLAGLAAGAVSSKSKEAQVLLMLINNDTLVQEGVAEGSAKSTDIGIGGFGLGGAGGVLGGAGGSAWNNTAEGKVVAAALMDATNKLVPLLRNLNVPQAPVASSEGEKKQQ